MLKHVAHRLLHQAAKLTGAHAIGQQMLQGIRFDHPRQRHLALVQHWLQSVAQRCQLVGQITLVVAHHIHQQTQIEHALLQRLHDGMRLVGG
ncbi:hypothetical protein SDC9_145940 [bioreactor metagenome]|uniref:Uncharacterized protein n=1 Tax=bioreactor metagenome TaxID=1076179 RepID=A0A645EAD0_9ZZZZ